MIGIDHGNQLVFCGIKAFLAITGKARVETFNYDNVLEFPGNCHSIVSRMAVNQNDLVRIVRVDRLQTLAQPLFLVTDTNDN